MPFTKTFHGFIENITDTLLIIEACRNGLLPTINRRLVERERSAIKSGTIIVFDESESGIKRWTDGFLWSPSRILGNFLVYRELANRENRTIEDDYTLSRQTSPINNNNDSNLALLHQRERALVGSLTTANTTYNFKKNGLLKKTIRIMVNGNYLHIVSYYNKNDVLNNLLPTPSASPQLACLQISADLMPHLQGFTQQQQNTTTMPPLQHHTNNTRSTDMNSPTRKRSKSSDDHRNRERSNYLPSQQQQQTRYYSLPTTSDIPALSYPSTYFNDHRDYYNKNNSTPFTELPPPLPSSTTFSDYMTTNNNKKTYSSSTSEPLLSPSPSPTPSPPTTLPRVCHNERYFHNNNQILVDSNSTHSNPHFYRSSARPSSTTLDNY